MTPIRRIAAQKTGVLNAPAQAVWELLVEWGAVAKWLNGFPLEKVEMPESEKAVPRTRVLWLSGTPVRETLIHQDDTARRIYYQLSDDGIPGIHNYLATTFIDEIDEKRCRIGCMSFFDVVPAAADAEQLRSYIETIYEQGIIGGFARYFERNAGP